MTTRKLSSVLAGVLSLFLSGAAAAQVTYTQYNSTANPAELSYSWVDISASGTSVGVLADDIVYGPIDIGFTFSFYGNNYTQLTISNNGLVTFDLGTGTPFVNVVIPTPGDPDNACFALWDDIDSETGQILYETLGTAPDRQFVVEWIDVNHYSNEPGTVTFEIVLLETSNIIVFQYQDVDFSDAAYNSGQSATVGIEDATASVASIQFSFDTMSLQDSFAICYVPSTYGGAPPYWPPSVVTIITIGGPPSTVGGDIWIPINTPDEAGYQMLFTAADMLGSAGNITLLRWLPWDNTGPPATADIDTVTITLGHTTVATLGNNFAANITGSSTVVYNAAYTIPVTVADGVWEPINFTTPFNYNGTDNLVVQIVCQFDGTEATTNYWGGFTDATAVWNIYDWPPPLDGVADGSFGAGGDTKFSIQFVINTGGGGPGPGSVSDHVGGGGGGDGEGCFLNHDPEHKRSMSMIAFIFLFITVLALQVSRRAIRGRGCV